MLGELLTTSTIPPFLFRAASHLPTDVKVADRPTIQARAIKDTISRGINSVEVIDPLDGYGQKYHADLADLERTDAIRHMLKNHVNYENRVPSEFSSWSVSLLYVVVHAIRKSYNEQNGMLIYVMDTSKLPPSRIANARELLRKHGLESSPNLMDYALGEYLIHGKLTNADNLWSAVPLERLVVAGLFHAFAELSDRQGTDLLKARVRQLREAYYFFARPTEVPRWHLESFYDIAKCFGVDWQGLVTMALVSFRKRDLSADLLTDLAHELGLLHIELPQLPLFCAVHLMVRDIPESRQFYTLLRLLNEREASIQTECLIVSSQRGLESNSSEADDEEDERGYMQMGSSTQEMSD